MSYCLLFLLFQMRVQLAKVISQCLYLLDLVNRRQTGTDLGPSARNIEETLDGLIKQVCEQAKRLRVSIVLIHHKPIGTYNSKLVHTPIEDWNALPETISIANAPDHTECKTAIHISN